MVFDGSFEYENDTIYYKIVDDNYPIKTIRGVEKTSKYFNFYDSNEKHIDVTHVYDTFENLSNITPSYALEKYKEHISNK